jgi:threonine dehydratase
LDASVGASIFLKAEVFQRGGAFKFRGAFNRMSFLSDSERVRGVIAMSSGNHGQAVALCARLFGTSAVIVMPKDAPRSKMEAVEGYGAEIVTYDRYTEDRAEVVDRLVAARGLTPIPPYDDYQVMAGAGTVALELFEQVSALDVLVVPMSGGGLMAGCSTVFRALSPGTRIVGVEPFTGDDTKRSLEAGERVRIPVPRTIADGLQVDIPGVLTFEINRLTVDEVVTVSEESLVDAVAFLFGRMKVVVEPSGAAGVAALRSGSLRADGQRVGVVLSGGNVDLSLLVDWVAARPDV